MQQKVAFQRKSFQFKALANNNTIVGHEKQAFTLETTVKPISSHMLPLWLSAQVCRAKKQHNKQISIPVLKSKRIKTYQFLIFNESHQFFRLERIYPANTQRSSEIWLDKNKNCLPTKTLHREADEPVIETKLLTHNIIKANNLKNSSAK